MTTTLPSTSAPTGTSVPPGTPVELVEVGPRDGLQNEDRALPVETRVALVERLLGLGLRRLEVASFVRPDRVPQMAGAEELLAALPRDAGARYIGLVLNRRGAERAVGTGCHELNMVVPVTDEFARRNQGTDTAELVRQTAGVVEVAREAGLGVSVTLAVAFGCPFEGRVTTSQVAPVVDQLLDLGIDELALADTVGVGVPPQVHDLAQLVLGDARLPVLRFHFHNTRNTGYANAWAAATLPVTEHGQRLALDASIGGFGGCPFAPAATGNIATEDLASLLRRAAVPVTGPEQLDVAAAGEVATWLSDELGSPVQGLLAKAGDAPGRA